MVRDFITSFGNVDSFDIMGRAMKIVEEAEVVATDLYGPGLSPRQQQQLMFEKVLFAWYETLLHRDLRNTHYAFVIYFCDGRLCPFYSMKWKDFRLGVIADAYLRVFQTDPYFVTFPNGVSYPSISEQRSHVYFRSSSV